MFEWRGITVYSYPAMLYVGLCIGTVAGNLAAHEAGVDAFRVFVATMILIPLALVGARMLHVITHWSRYSADRTRIWDKRSGGLAQYGGLPLVIPISLPLLRALDIPFGTFWDIGAITILTGMIFTRVGCLMNGCCAGRESTLPFALHLPNHLGIWKRRIPTQLLEALWATMILGAGIAIWFRLPFDGALFMFIAAGYGAGRLGLESTREPGHGTKRGFTVHHAISILIIALCGFALMVRSII
jgi:prolipoprotein diacylglyceryltransferase